jgi:hypothetical protein
MEFEAVEFLSVNAEQSKMPPITPNPQLEPGEEIADHEGTGTNNDFGIQNRIPLSMNLLGAPASRRPVGS